jgi:hypothetical protein
MLLLAGLVGWTWHINAAAQATSTSYYHPVHHCFAVFSPTTMQPNSGAVLHA